MTENIESMTENTPDSGLVPIPTELGQEAADNVIAEIRGRSFSGRHPELGKMINCPHCGRRHRSVETHTQVFARRWNPIDFDYTDEQLIAGETPESGPKTQKTVLGARFFAKRRLKPPLNRRQNMFVQTVRDLIPDEYTQEDLDKARKKARRILSKKYGRHGFLPPLRSSRGTK